MENEYGIKVDNKYALFLNEDEESLDLEILRLQSEAKTKKAEKAKKNAAKDKEEKAAVNKESTPSSAGQEKKVEKIDQFSSPTVVAEPAVKQPGNQLAGGNAPASSEGQTDMNKGNRRERDNRPRPPRFNKDKDNENKGNEPVVDNRPPRIRARGSAFRGRGRGSRPLQQDGDQQNDDNTEKPNSIGYFDANEHRSPKKQFFGPTS